MPIKYTKKVVKKSRRIRKPSMKTKSLIKLIKKVSLRPCETKATHIIAENQQLYHNVPYLSYGGLNTTNGVSEVNTGTASVNMRVGDEIIGRGLSYKFWFANKLDRPNVMYKMIFYKYQSNYTPASPNPFCNQGTTNYMIRDLDTEKFKIIKVVNFNLQTNAQRLFGDALVGAEGHRKISVWIPLKNQKIKYEDNSSVPRFIDYAFTIVAYDSFGTLLTDNIGSFAVNRKLYFKDP